MPLSPPLDCSGSCVFEEAYAVFEAELKDKDARPRLRERFVFIDFDDEFLGKSRAFWHIVSIGADDSKYEKLPCAGDPAAAFCTYQCDPDHEENFLREENSIPCCFRACRIRWIREILNLANENPPMPLLRVWKQRNQRTGENNLLIRFTENEVDYVVIFRVCYKHGDIYMYQLMTAYPVVLPGYKRRFDKEYENYCRKK